MPLKYKYKVDVYINDEETHIGGREVWDPQKFRLLPGEVNKQADRYNG